MTDFNAIDQFDTTPIPARLYFTGLAWKCMAEVSLIVALFALSYLISPVTGEQAPAGVPLPPAGADIFHATKITGGYSSD